MGAGQSLQLEELFGRILDNLSSVGRRWWTNLHRKLVASDPNPFSLHLLHVLSQSFVGEESSAHDMMKSIWLSSNWCMVTSSSTRSLYHCLVDMVATLRGVVSLTWRMVWKKGGEKYGGIGGLTGTDSSPRTLMEDEVK